MKQSSLNPLRFALLALAGLIAWAHAPAAMAQSYTKLRNICRIKGQEENLLHGFGLVVGLNGTGATKDLATMQALSKLMIEMGIPVSDTGRFDERAEEALKNVKNVALVRVTATVPSTGARTGDQLDCYVSAINGKSLEGGRLEFTYLVGPNKSDNRIYAVCNGQLQVDDPSQPMVAVVHNGCRMEQDVYTKYMTDDHWITFVLNHNHADFLVASEVAEAIGNKYSDNYLDASIDFEANRQEYVHAVDAANVRVRVPEGSYNDEVAFISDLLETRIINAEPEARVVINSRTGSIVISGDVEIGDVLFSHRNLMVETGAAAGFLPIDVSQSNKPKLDKLVQALANLKVPAEDVVQIIKAIDDMGKLHAKLIIK
ncbi:Flagellar P-ring protein precursor [Pseudobythopirellula maris]|uniref:Flagellar P-ring protein n=1 Tax=Pseudobythopirellula maris TaxID=2527991 RepID=A0A5C5ZLA5_9BACT|nr:flagellar basal body P-ring protein FlgI [Pseudobythopirellula maris]TWT88222.1 Flagellar P-ring protein precursor [Pseudobythopirellula maris]